MEHVGPSLFVKQQLLGRNNYLIKTRLLPLHLSPKKLQEEKARAEHQSLVHDALSPRAFVLWGLLTVALRSLPMFSHTLKHAL